MKEVFFVTKVNADLSITLASNTEFASYAEAQAAIEKLPNGTYQVQKFFQKG